MPETAIDKIPSKYFGADAVNLFMRVHIVACIFLCLAGCGQIKKELTDGKKADSSFDTHKVQPVTTHKRKKQIITGPLPSFAKAHPKAKILLSESFYFNAVDEAAPFANHEGTDAWLAFNDWRYTHKNNNPKEFLSEHIHDLGYPEFDVTETNFIKLTPYLEQHEFGSRLMSGIDANIISIAFGQLYLEGAIDSSFKQTAKVAIHRQLIPELLAVWGEPYQTERKKKLIKMLAVLNK